MWYADSQGFSHAGGNMSGATETLFASGAELFKNPDMDMEIC